MSIETLLFKEISIFPELFLGISLVYLVLHGSFVSMRNEYPLIQTSMVYLGVLVLVLSVLLLLNDQLHVLGLGIFNNTISNDYVSFSSKVITGILSIVCLLMVQSYLISQKINQFEYVLLFLFSVLGLFILCSANDLITAYLAIELQTLAFYVLASFNRNSTFSVDAGIKYFILGSLSSGIFLFGASLLYGVSGTVNFTEFRELFVFQTEFKENTNLDDLSEIYHHSLLMSHIKSDLNYYLIKGDIKILEKFPVLMSEISYFNLDSFIDKLCVINLLIEKYDSILLFLILNFKDFEIGSLIFDMYSFKNLDNNSGIIFLISLLEMSNTYLSNLFTLEECFNLELIKFALLFILISLLFKLAVAPFHIWSPDVYENSPSASTFFFSVVPKLSIFILMIRIFYYSFFSFFETWKIILISVISLTVLIGSFGGIEQRKLKSLLVYSSISHMGYSLIAFGSGTFDNLQILFSYLIIYSFSGLCIWSIFILTRVKSNHFKKQNKDLTDLVSFSKSNYTLATFFSVVLFSVAGFPPMIGFLVKINIFLTAIESSMYFIVLVSILCSVVATFFYIRIIKILYFENLTAGKLYYPISSSGIYLLSGLFWSLVFLFINPSLFFLFSYKYSLLF